LFPLELATPVRQSYDFRMKRRAPTVSSAGLWLYGIHPVRAALANPRRKVHRALLTHHAAEAIGRPLLARVRHDIAALEQVARSVPPGAVHQGVSLLCEPLTKRDLEDMFELRGDKRRIAVVLDQITDPHNVGAILRSAVAFDALAVVVQDRHAPPESGVLAKAASGALDLIPYIQVVNVARAMEALGERGFWRVALTGDGTQPLRDAVGQGDVAVVLGSEGSGVRRLVRERCDTTAAIPIASAMESLNVSNAAAIALYEARREAATG
jgi:23S rRNA (guanosine2251-2'-O)-methyltransferase